MNVRPQTLGWLTLLVLLVMNSLSAEAQSVRRPRRATGAADSIARQRRLAIREALQRLSDSVAMVKQRGPYNLVVTAGGGLSYYSTHLGVPDALDQVRISRFGIPGSLRVMWYPDHRLRIGLETGWTTMYNYRGVVGSDKAQVHVSTVPVLVVFSMPLAWLSGTDRSLARRFALSVGTGLYINYTRLNYLGKVSSSTNSLGWMAAGSYTYPLGRRFRLAGELKWYDAVAAENAAFTAELQLVWRAFSW